MMSQSAAHRLLSLMPEVGVMKIAIPIWQGRISPVMDVAARMLVAEYDGTGEVSRVEESLGDDFIPRRARHLADLGVNVLICGGISRPLLTLITAQGITVIPGITGKIEQVLEAYRYNRLHIPKYMMPGHGRCRRGRGQGQDHGYGQGCQQRMGQGRRQGRESKRMNQDREVF
jgi:predicted Fe-Mo cluster-binding NifX family protein